MSDEELKLLKAFILARNFLPKHLDTVAALSAEDFTRLQEAIIGPSGKTPNTEFKNFFDYTLAAFLYLLRSKNTRDPKTMELACHLMARAAWLGSLVLDYPDHPSTQELLSIKFDIDGHKLAFNQLCEGFIAEALEGTLHCSAHPLKSGITLRLLQEAHKRIIPRDSIEVAI